MDFSDWLWQISGKTSGLTPENLLDALFDYLTGPRTMPEEEAERLPGERGTL